VTVTTKAISTDPVATPLWLYSPDQWAVFVDAPQRRSGIIPRFAGLATVDGVLVKWGLLGTIYGQLPKSSARKETL
jgi:hypothetical protein